MPSFSPKSPDSWILVASLLAIVGIAAHVLGRILKMPWLSWAGLALIAPLLLGGVILMLVVIPLLIVKNAKNRKSSGS